MSSVSAPDLTPARTARLRRKRLNEVDRRGNLWLRGIALAGGGLLFIALLAIVVLIISGASASFNKYGLGFVGHTGWVATLDQYGGWTYIYGSLITAVFSTLFATVIGVSIGLFLALIAPRRVAAVVGPLVELLAAVPSVIIGLIGIAVICPFIANDLESPLHAVLGWTGLFGAPESAGNSLFAAVLVLTIMVVPIIAALSRDLFATVSIELRDGAEALGATRWEMIRAVVLPTTRSGVIAAILLGFGRAVGEAIAVEQVVGGTAQAKGDLFQSGDTIAAKIASEFAGAGTHLDTSSLYYLGAILLVIVIVTILLARYIAGDFGDFSIRKMGRMSLSLARAETGIVKQDVGEVG